MVEKRILGYQRVRCSLIDFPTVRSSQRVAIRRGKKEGGSSANGMDGGPSLISQTPSSFGDYMTTHAPRSSLARSTGCCTPVELGLPISASIPLGTSKVYVGQAEQACTCWSMRDWGEEASCSELLYTPPLLLRNWHLGCCLRRRNVLGGAKGCGWHIGWATTRPTIDGGVALARELHCSASSALILASLPLSFRRELKIAMTRPTIVAIRLAFIERSSLARYCERGCHSHLGKGSDTKSRRW